jgi:molybdopterin-guanine dinucleotide biosynthesis protein A
MATETLYGSEAPVFKVDGELTGRLARDLNYLAVDETTAGLKALRARFGNWGSREGQTDESFLYLDGATLDHLLAARAPDEDATAFRSTHDGLPEPLCAIYEPRAAAKLAAQVAAGRNCPRKFLINAHTHLLDQRDPRALDNVNTLDEYANAMTAIDLPAREIRVQYFALLREQSGRSEETLSTRARTPRELYGELATRYPFTLPAEMLRVAVNAEFGEWTQPLKAGDAVVFIPPVAGG